MKNINYKYLDNNTIPHGLAAQLKPIFSSTNNDEKIQLNTSRNFLERFLLHLSSISGISLREVPSIIDKLVSTGLISNEARPYLHLWWNISCLGSHFQDLAYPSISWAQHLEMCRDCIELCMLWYLKKYPPSNLADDVRRMWIEDASLLSSTPYNEVQLCSESEIKQCLEKYNFVLLTGRSWVGKTSIGSWLVTDYVNNGYIPLVLHENSLVTHRILSDDKTTSDPKNLRNASNAQKLHQLIITRLIHGESFVILLDDPFGHRYFKSYNPLMFLRMAEWLNLAAHHNSLGSIKVIITTPLLFLDQAKSILAENGIINPISQANQYLLDKKTHIILDINQYNKSQILNVVYNVARYHNCTWKKNKDRCEIVADELVQGGFGFDKLQLLCKDLKSADDDQFLDKVMALISAADIAENIQSSSEWTKIQLSSAFVGEALIEFYREFRFQTKLEFNDVVGAVSSASQVRCKSNNDLNFLDWVLMDKVSTLELSGFPVFSHPEIRYAVALLVDSDARHIVHEIVTNVSGLNGDYNGKKLAKWEGVHLLCRMAKFIREDQLQQIYEEFFFRRITGGGDPRNVLWAILNNWNYIEDTTLVNSAVGFLKSISGNYKWLCRPFIWEASANWTLINESIRYLVLEQTAHRDFSGDLKPIYNEHNTLAFLAAGVTHYGSIQESARAGCDASEKYLDFLNIFLSQVSKPSKLSYVSRTGDGLFDAPGNRYSGEDVIQKLLHVGLKSGSLVASHPLALQLSKIEKHGGI